MKKKFNLFGLTLCLLPVLGSYAEFVRAQEISPAQEQEFIDAKVALGAAQKAQAEKYAPEPLNRPGTFWSR